ncbi:zinc-containing alcohol dehydrogenase [Sparganum proliferum]
MNRLKMFFLILLSSVAVVLGEDDDICSMPLDKGPCNDSLIRYGYDNRTGQCKQFMFGGCDGNDNIFLTRTGCERATARCSSNVPLDICNMPIERGRCRASIDRYGYDKETGECKEFTFGGCGGNENNFYTQEECERAASRCLNKDTAGVERMGKTGASRDDLQQVNSAYILQAKIITLWILLYFL